MASVSTDQLTLGIRDGVFHIGDRAYPWAEVDVHDATLSTPPLKKWRTRRARLKFENGWSLSVVFGSGTYSSNRDSDWRDTEPFSEEARTAELAAWPRDGEFATWPDGDTVVGWVP